MSQSVLIIEDEPDIRNLLSFNLQKEGYNTYEAENGKEGLLLAKEHLPDIILLDLMMPVMDGLTVCKELQKDSRTDAIPVIILTAKGEELDRVLGLELGADDYVVKPFSIRELLLRIKSILRRQNQNLEQESLSRHGVRIEISAHQVFLERTQIDLTATEFRLLEDLLRHAGSVRSREQLLNSVWGYQFEGYARTVDTHVRRLRSKLGNAEQYVETVRSIGYRFKA